MQSPDFRDVARQHPLREQLSRYGIRLKGKRFCCPFHGDKTPSANLFTHSDGIEKAYCHPCKLTFDTVELVARMENTDHQGAVAIISGFKPAMKPQPIPSHQEPEFHLTAIPEDKLPKPGRAFDYLKSNGKSEGSKQTPEAIYVYRDASGTAQGLVARFVTHEGKKRPLPFRWCSLRSRLVNKGWPQGKSPPLYNARLLAEHPTKPVLVVEGEKVVDALQPFLEEWVLTTWQGGSGQVGNRDLSALKGRRVTFWPDMDAKEPDQQEGKGEKAMREAMLASGAAVSRWLQPPEEWRSRADGFDAYDLWKEEGIMAVRAALDSLADEVKPEPAQAMTESRLLTMDWLPPGKHLIKSLKDDRLKVSSEANHVLFLLHHPRLKGRLVYDEFEQKVLLDGQEMTEMDVLHMVVELCSEPFNLDIKSASLGTLVNSIARGNVVNSLGDKLRAMAETWDGKSRYLLDYAGVEPTEWSQLVSRRWGIGLAKRIMFPGCAHDGVLVLEGAQGIGKTTFLNVLGNSLGRDLLVQLHSLKLEDQDAMSLQGKALVDMSELTALRKAEVTAFKALTGARSDRYREPWGRKYRDFPRTCVFAGTTNKTKEYLNDPTGHRRIWPVVVTKFGDLEAFNRDLPQIWAELAKRALDGEPNDMVGSECNLQKTEAAEREAIDPWYVILEEMASHLDVISDEKLWQEFLEVPRERRNGSNADRVGTIMRKLGYSRKRLSAASTGIRPWGWSRA